MLLRFNSINNTDNTSSYMIPCGYVAKYVQMLRYICMCVCVFVCLCVHCVYIYMCVCVNFTSVCKLLFPMAAHTYIFINMTGEFQFLLFWLLMNNYTIRFFLLFTCFHTQISYYVVLSMLLCVSLVTLTQFTYSDLLWKGNQDSYAALVVSQCEQR